MTKSIEELLEETKGLNLEIKNLKQNLLEAKESIDAINAGKIDALVISDENHLKVFTEKTADKTYRILIEKMHEGAVTMDKDATILYSNIAFANMVNMPLQKVIGTKFKNFIDDYSKEHFENLLKRGWEKAVNEEVRIYTSERKGIQVLMSVNTLSLDDHFVLSIIITDLTIQNKNQEELRLRSKELEQKNIEKDSANKDLAFQMEEKEKRSRELKIVNKELAFQNKEKEKRAVELSIANRELAFQNEEKEKRAIELSIANKELAFQNKEKEKRTEELSLANKDLTTFNYVSSHDLQEPLRKIKNYVTVLLNSEEKNLSQVGKDYLQKMYDISKGMQELIEDLQTYYSTKDAKRNFEKTNLTIIVDEVKKYFEVLIQDKKVTIDAVSLCEVNIIRIQFRQLFQNLISNSIKFSKPEIAPHIVVKSEIVEGSKLNNEKLSSNSTYCHITYTDNGIGFDSQYNERVFKVFQRLHSKEEYEGNGIGLAICKRIVENHNGTITATGELNKGVQFDIYIPV